MVPALHVETLRLREEKMGGQDPKETNMVLAFPSDRRSTSPRASPASCCFLHLQWSLLLDAEHLPPKGQGIPARGFK